MYNNYIVYKQTNYCNTKSYDYFKNTFIIEYFRFKNEKRIKINNFFRKYFSLNVLDLEAFCIKKINALYFLPSIQKRLRGNIIP